MKKLMTYFLLGLASFSFAHLAPAATEQEKDTYKQAKRDADSTYKAAREKCNELSGNPKDVCIAEAKAAESRSKADAEAKYKNSSKAYLEARIAGVDADFAVAKEKCSAKSGNEKNLCLEEARAAHTKAIVDAKSKKEIRDLKSEASEDKREADYKVELEKCERMGGSTKDSCIAAAKAKYGK